MAYTCLAAPQRSDCSVPRPSADPTSSPSSSFCVSSSRPDPRTASWVAAAAGGPVMDYDWSSYGCLGARGHFWRRVAKWSLCVAAGSCA